MSSASDVVGRDSELVCVGDFVEAISAGPSALILVGEAGIGKTTLWRDGVAAATERRFRALSCRPVEAEIELPFAALGDLLEDVSDDVLAGLPDPQREALEIALLRAETKPARSEGRAVALGLLGVMRMVRACLRFGWASSGGLIQFVDVAGWCWRGCSSRSGPAPFGEPATRVCGHEHDRGAGRRRSH